ncbi:MAG: DUF86 domain-containing protein [Bacteroidetes bacterium]|nr:DUF86 domain-containing protein [Bacteroidota bacterium]
MLQFIIIGEAIIHVEDEKLDKYNYPWYKVRSFRNMIAHEYFNIKLPAVWMIIENDLQQLKKVVNLIPLSKFQPPKNRIHRIKPSNPCQQRFFVP